MSAILCKTRRKFKDKENETFLSRDFFFRIDTCICVLKRSVYYKLITKPSDVDSQTFPLN